MRATRQAQFAATGEASFGSYPSWPPATLRAFVGVSGAYDLDGLAEHLHRRGLYRGLFEQIMSLDGRPAYNELSPVQVVGRLGAAGARHLPPIFLMHGTNDKSVPHESSVHLCSALKVSHRARRTSAQRVCNPGFHDTAYHTNARAIPTAMNECQSWS